MDTIANIITTLQNAQKRQKMSCFLPFSKKTQNILNILFIEGYIKGYTKVVNTCSTSLSEKSMGVSPLSTLLHVPKRSSGSDHVAPQSFQFRRSDADLQVRGRGFASCISGHNHHYPFGPQNQICRFKVFFKYFENKEEGMTFLKIKRVSKPGKRIYIQSKYINKIQRGLGILILSTSKGILSDRDARYLNLGGEALCILS